MTVYSADVIQQYAGMIAKLSVAAAAARVRLDAQIAEADALPLNEQMARKDALMRGLVREREARQVMSKQ
jgi:hypothetical protein